MATMDTLALTERWFHEVWGQGREATIGELMAEDYVGYGLAEEPTMGREGFVRIYRMWRGAFSEIEVTLHDCIAMGNKSACYYTFNGTHTGDALGFPATGKQGTMAGMSFMEWKDGKIIRAVDHVDRLDMMRQLGVLKVGV